MHTAPCILLTVMYALVAWIPLVNYQARVRVFFLVSIKYRNPNLLLHKKQKMHIEASCAHASPSARKRQIEP